MNPLEPASSPGPPHREPASGTGPAHDLRPPAWRTLLPAGILQLGLLAALGWWPGGTLPWPGLVLFLGAFGVYLWTAARLLRLQGGTRLIWWFAVALRLVFVPLEPTLSDDVYRYLWDGRVQAAGINPYLHAPSAPELQEMRAPWHDRINNPDVPTIYPPAAQLLFLALALAGGTILQAKLLFLGFDLATGWVLGLVAGRTRRSRRLTWLLYLWSPLLVVEVAWSAHLEPVGLLGLALFLLLVHRKLAAGAALALAVLTKLAPAAALPPLTRHLGGRFAAAFLAVVALLYLPYLGAGGALWTGLGTYAEHWRFMEGPFVLLEAVVPEGRRSRMVAGGLVLAAVAGTTWGRFTPERALLWVLGAGMLLTPTLHPWYVLWMLPMAALRASRPWILLSGLAFLGYFGLDTYQATGIWPQPPWLRGLLWLPVLGLLVWEGLAASGRRSSGVLPEASA